MRIIMGKKVLIVDDDLDLQDIVKNALEIEGYDVLVANNGKEGLEVLSKNAGDISCIILDLMMPIMDGTEMLEKVRKDPKLAEIPVIISTAKGSVDQKNIDNSQAVIKKPMKIDVLYNAVSKYSH